jgi:hypothetical protein
MCDLTNRSGSSIVCLDYQASSQPPHRHEEQKFPSPWLITPSILNLIVKQEEK